MLNRIVPDIRFWGARIIRQWQIIFAKSFFQHFDIFANCHFWSLLVDSGKGQHTKSLKMIRSLWDWIHCKMIKIFNQPCQNMKLIFMCNGSQVGKAKSSFEQIKLKKYYLLWKSQKNSNIRAKEGNIRLLFLDSLISTQEGRPLMNIITVLLSKKSSACFSQ